jgi:hypothetical protein
MATVHVKIGADRRTLSAQQRTDVLQQVIGMCFSATTLEAMFKKIKISGITVWSSECLSSLSPDDKWAVIDNVAKFLGIEDTLQAGYHTQTVIKIE